MSESTISVRMYSVILLVILLLALPAHGQMTIHITPEGDDSAAGTADAPLQTMRAARDRLRLLRGKQPGNATVVIGDGQYVLRETLVLDQRDAQTTWVAADEASPRVTSTVPVTGWRRLNRFPEFLPPAARGKVWVAAFPEGVGNPTVAFVMGKMIHRARSEAFSLPVDRQPDALARDRIFLPKGIYLPDADLGDAGLAGVFYNPWTMNLLPIRARAASGALLTKVKSTYPMVGVRFGDFDDGHCWLVNGLSMLDKPGEFVVRASERKVYWWPRSGEPEGFRVPLLTELIRVEGRIDYEGPRDEPVNGIQFEGLTFTGADHCRWTADQWGWGLQHDWNFFDRPTAMLRFRGAEGCRVSQCVFAQTGGDAIRLDLYAQKITISHNTMRNLGGGGVLLAGYGPGKKDVNRNNIVSDNSIQDIGLVTWHAPAIWAWQSGRNKIIHNRIERTGYTAIMITGRVITQPNRQGEGHKTIRWREYPRELGWEKTQAHWAKREFSLHARHNLVAYNDISHCMQRLGDGNAIYVSGAGAGNRIRSNYIHDILGPHMNAAIRCDDDQHDTIIEGNLITHCVGEGFIIKGRNTIRHNIVSFLMDTTPDGIQAVHRRGFLQAHTTSVDGSIITNNVFLATKKGIKAMTLTQGLSGSKVDHNIWWNTAEPDWGRRAIDELKKLGQANQSKAADPLFQNIGAREFSIKSSSPLHDIGLRPLDPRRTGPRS